MKFPSPGAERVARALHETGPATAAVLAESLGLSGAVVRRHLDTLCTEGFVLASDRPPFGPTPERRRGRPARVFSLTDRGSHAFEVAYDDLALSALRYLAEGGASAVKGATDQDPVAAFAEHRARSWVARHAQTLAAVPDTPERVDTLVGILNDEGYSATCVEAEGMAAVQVCQHHCPIAHVATAFPELCEAETQAFQTLLGTHVLRLATIAHGDGVCTTLVPLTTSAEERA